MMIGWRIAAPSPTDRLIVALDSRIKLSLDAGVRGERDRLLSLQVLEHDVRLGEQELVAKQPTNLLHIDLVKVVLVQRALESAQTFEDLEDFAL